MANLMICTPPQLYRNHTQCRELQDPARELQGQVRTRLPERIRELPDQVRIDPDRAPKSFVGRFLAQLGRTTADSRLLWPLTGACNIIRFGATDVTKLNTFIWLDDTTHLPMNS